MRAGHHKRRRVNDRESVKTQSYSSRRGFLRLPNEVLTEIFVLAGSSALAEVNRRFAWLAYADHSAGPPPLWLQKRFTASLHPDLPFAVDMALRRRFFSSSLLLHFAKAFDESQSWHLLTIPLCLLVQPANDCDSTSGGQPSHYVEQAAVRRVMLLTELFLRGVTLTETSANIALIRYAEQRRARPALIFWRMTRSFAFDTAYITKALRIAAKAGAYREGEMLQFLLRRFGCSDDDGRALVRIAVKRKDFGLLDTLRRHGVQPHMDALMALAR
ncbi:hypothetical protein PYCC9005_000041 [Savitreella phatthalungensis]